MKVKYKPKFFGAEPIILHISRHFQLSPNNKASTSYIICLQQIKMFTLQLVQEDGDHATLYNGLQIIYYFEK